MSVLNTKIRGAQIATAVAGDGLKKDASDNLALDLNELTGASVAVASDSIAIIDASDSNASRKESIVNLVAGIAGSGLTATSGVLSVNSIANNVVEADIVKEDMSATADGIETVYALANVPLSASLQVYLNGLLQQIGTSKDYRLNPTSGQTQHVVFYTAPATGDIVLIHYIIDNA